MLGEKIDNLKYIIPHQSNIRILDSISDKLSCDKLYSNLEKYGNTFCASIPIALDDISNNLESGDKIILTGYGGGLNLGSIFLEI